MSQRDSPGQLSHALTASPTARYSESRAVPKRSGNSLDLGGTRLEMTEAVFRDLITTRWAFDTSRKALFAGDGFSYRHYHEDGHCGRIAEEAESIDVADQVALFAMAAFSLVARQSLFPTRDTDMSTT
jgi:hypothetical protein